MKLGFTGSRFGLSNEQKTSILDYLSTNDVKELHHGDCIGSDSDVHILVKQFHPDIKIVIHPPNNPEMRAFMVANEQKPCYEYLQRNRNIVDSVDILIACPNSPKELLRSGTWSTVRYARKIGKNHKIFI